MTNKPKATDGPWFVEKPTDRHTWQVRANFADGLPGTALIAEFGYKPNAELTAVAPELLRLAAIVARRPIGSTARDTCEAQVALHRICLELGAL
jgi:hypothetical protein